MPFSWIRGPRARSWSLALLTFWLLFATLGLAGRPGSAQDLPPHRRLIIVSTSRWGDGLSAVVKNLGPGKMCSVVIPTYPFVEDNSAVARGEYGTTKVVKQDLGTLEANQEASFNLNSVFVKGRMPGLSVTGAPCRQESERVHRSGRDGQPEHTAWGRGRTPQAIPMPPGGAASPRC